MLRPVKDRLRKALKTPARWVLQAELMDLKAVLQSYENERQRLNERLSLAVCRLEDARLELDEARPFTSEGLRSRAMALLSDGEALTKTQTATALVLLAATERGQRGGGFGVVSPADRWGADPLFFSK